MKDVLIHLPVTPLLIIALCNLVFALVVFGYALAVHGFARAQVQRLTFKLWQRKARKELCFGCGNPKNEGVHGYFSEYGGCV